MQVEVEVLRPVLIGNRMYAAGEKLQLTVQRAKRLEAGDKPAVKLQEGVSPLTRQILASSPDATVTPQGAPQTSGSNSQPSENSNPAASPGGLMVESLVARGIPEKLARILTDAGLRSDAELTQERLLQIEGIGEKSAELILATLKPAS